MCNQSVFIVIMNTCPIYLIPKVKNALGAYIITLNKRKIYREVTFNSFWWPEINLVKK